MALDDAVREMEDDYWYSIHNRLPKNIIENAYFSYERFVRQFEILKRPLPENHFPEIHEHFYQKYCKDRF